MTVWSLASGSAGNATLVASGGTRILVDLGLSYRELRKRAESVGQTLDGLAGVLFTHEHGDHCRGLPTFRKNRPEVPLFANGNTADVIAHAQKVDEGWQVFETAEPFDVGCLTVTPFSISHDVADPVGYLVSDGAATLFIGTDTGVATVGFKAAFARANAAILESNHDPILLAQSKRSPELKRRIAGRSGHLSNDQACEVVAETNPPGLRLILLAHLSRECNEPSLARAAMRRTLASLGRDDVALDVLEQDVVRGPWEI